MRRWLILTMAMALLVVALGVAQTQSDGSDPDSPSNTADVTGMIFEEENDLYLDPNGFHELDSSVLFLQFDMPNTGATGEGFEIGAGTTIGDIYAGLYYGTVYPGGSGTLEEVDIDEAFVVDANNVITGRNTTRTVEVDYDYTAYNSAVALVGLGGLGFGVDFVQDGSSDFGNFTADFVMPGGPTWNGASVGTAPATATTFTAFDASGNVQSVSSQEYAAGYDRGGYTGNDSRVGGILRFGMGLPVGGVELDLSANAGVFWVNDNKYAAFEAYERIVGSPDAISYTPTTTLPDQEATEITDLTSYTYDEASETDQRLSVEPSVGVETEYPLADWVTATGALAYYGGFPFRRATYTDFAGEEQRIRGLADIYYSIEVETDANTTDPNLTTTTTTVMEVYETEEVSGTDHWVVPELGVVLEPSERFRAAINYVPVLNFSRTTTTYGGQARTTATVENGDESSGEGDSVTETTVTRGAYTETTSSRNLTNLVRTAAQFFLIPDRLRINLGAEVNNSLVTTTQSETVTEAPAEYEVREAVDTSEPSEEDFVQTDYQIDNNFTDDPSPDQRRSLTKAGGSSVTYEAGLTYFFNDDMFLDLRMDGGGGDIWNTNEWSLEMTILF